MEAIMNISFNKSHNIETRLGQPQAPVSPKAQAISDGVSKLLLQNVKIGDLLKVEVIDHLQKQITLMLGDGTIFEAKLDQPLDIYIGQQVALEVKDIIGKKVHMELVIKGEAGQNQAEENGHISNILKQLDIPVTKDAQEAVKFLMERMLPLTKESIKQIEFGLKSSQLPIDSLLSMLENEILIIPSTIKQMQAYENGEIKLQNQLEAMLGNLVNSDDLAVLEEAHKMLRAAKEQIDHMGDKPPSEMEGAELGKEAKASQEMIIGKALMTKHFSLSQEPLEGKDIRALKQEITNLFKESFFIDPAKLKDKADPKLEKINELYKEIYQLADKLGKQEENLPGQQRSQLYSDIKSNVEFLAMANKYDTMLHIPLLIQNQFKHGELYIFNKKKSGKKSYHEASMLISLETLSLGRIESLIKKYNKQITVQFKTDHEATEQVIKANIQLLKTSLKAKGYDLVSATYIPSSEPFTVKEALQTTGSGRYRFDTKA